MTAWLSVNSYTHRIYLYIGEEIVFKIIRVSCIFKKTQLRISWACSSPYASCLPHVHVMWSLRRLLLARLCSLATLARVRDQQSVTSRVAKRRQESTSRVAVSMVTSERCRLTCRRRRSGSAWRSRTSLNTGSRRHGAATRDSAWSWAEPLSKDHRTAFRDVQHSTGFSCASSKEKLESDPQLIHIRVHKTTKQ